MFVVRLSKLVRRICSFTPSSTLSLSLSLSRFLYKKKSPLLVTTTKTKIIHRLSKHCVTLGGWLIEFTYESQGFLTKIEPPINSMNDQFDPRIGIKPITLPAQNDSNNFSFNAVPNCACIHKY